jgi:hypothetical protein
MKVLSFDQYINEAREIPQDVSDTLASIKPTTDRLTFLLQKGLIDDSGYREKINNLLKTSFKLIKGLRLNPREEEDFEILKKLGSDSGLAALNALSTDGAKALAGQGLHLVSSPTQLANGTLVWSIDPKYRSANGWGLGFFPNVRAVRRMTPNQVDLGARWGRPGSMDIVIKRWKGSDHSTDLEFYDKAMQWAAENIDFEDVKLKPQPTAWKYYTKRTTGQRSPFNQESHEIKQEAERLFAEARRRRNYGIPSAQWNEMSLRAWTLLKQAAEIDNAPEKIKQATDAIQRLEQEIEEIKNRQSK